MSAVGARLRRWFLPLAIAVIVVAASVVPLPAFIELPGSATGIPACVGIDQRPGATVNGDYLFTTVSQRDATVFGLMIASVRDDQRVVAKQELLGGERRDRYLQRERQVFLDATQRAVVVALRAAGLPVDVVGEGVDIVDVMADTPADGVLQPGDVITAVDGTPVRTDGELIAAIGDVAPLELQVRREGAEMTEVVTPQVREVDGQRRPVIGVRISTHAPTVRLPFDVDIATGDVGGPSAGVMVALAVHDLVTDEDLASGRRVAGTGTLAVDGTVGDIGDVGLKVVAAARRGADLFIAPSSQAAAARAAVPAGSDMTVVGVDTFDDARSALVAGSDTVAARPAQPRPCRYPTGA